jgi:hypothetical protein
MPKQKKQNKLHMELEELLQTGCCQYTQFPTPPPPLADLSQLEPSSYPSSRQDLHLNENVLSDA